jgi:hypothetical protein
MFQHDNSPSRTPLFSFSVFILKEVRTMFKSLLNKLVRSIRRGIVAVGLLSGLCLIVLGTTLIVAPIILGLWLIKVMQPIAADRAESKNIIFVPASA